MGLESRSLVAGLVMNMTRSSAILLVVSLLVVSALSVGAATSRMPYGSFLTRPITDVNDFAELLRRDRVVGQRFARHFGMSAGALADYIEKHGRIKGLSNSHYYLEYFIDKRGQVHKHHKWLRPKHKVLFVNGTPVLDVQCGNPMTMSLPKFPEPPKPAARVTQAPPPVVRPGPRAPAPPPAVAPPPADVAEPPEPPAPEVVEEPGPTAPAPPPAEAPPPAQVVTAPPEAPVTPGRGGQSWLLPILAAVGIGASVDDGGNGGSGGNGGNGGNGGTTPPPGPVVPESGTLALGAGGIGFIMAWHRMRRGR